MRISVVIIGAGNMAHHLALAFSKAEVNLLQIYNRSRKGLIKIAALTKAPTTTRLDKLVKADVYILAIKDDAISKLAVELSKHIDTNAIIAHTSGACTIDIFRNYFSNYGAFYPLQSVKKERPVDFRKVPIFISANQKFTEKKLMSLANSISQNTIPIKDRDRSALHIPAVLVNNFVNHMYHLAFEFCKKEGLNFNHLLPLMEETFVRIKEGGIPSKQQTGPAIRDDKDTLKGHRRKLEEHQETLKLYNYLTRHIQDHYNENR